MVPCGWRMRSKENSTSSAVKAEPSWNFTFLRKLKRTVVGLTTCQLVASEGSTL